MTYIEKLRLERPECIDDDCLGGAEGCPYWHGYESKENRPCKNVKVCERVCHDCWNREIPGTNSNDYATTTNEKENNMATTKKTKAELMEELENVKKSKEELEKELKNLEKYKQYEDAAGEIHALYTSFVMVGFSENQAFELTKVILQNANYNITPASKPTYRSYR